MAETGLQRSDGFTLVELSVVVGIVGILVAIAIPTFAGVIENSQDVAAQALATHAMTIERAYHVEHGEYTTRAKDLTGYEPAIAWNKKNNPAGTIRIRLRNKFRAEEVCVYTRSESGAWFAIYESVNTATRYGRPDRLRSCSPTVARTWSPDGW